MTTLERTLIDITVRPLYGGGPELILNIYKKALPTVSIDKLIQLLKILQFTYPYHQSIGFYLSQAGFTRKKDLTLLKKMGMNFTFYLDYQMEDPVYSDDWNIYFPKKLISADAS